MWKLESVPRKDECPLSHTTIFPSYGRWSLIEKLEEDDLFWGYGEGHAGNEQRIKISDTMTRFLGNAARIPSRVKLFVGWESREFGRTERANCRFQWRRTQTFKMKRIPSFQVCVIFFHEFAPLRSVRTRDGKNS